MTYNEILAELHSLKCSSTAASLDYAIYIEAVSLCENMTSHKFKNSRQRIPNAAAIEAAKDFYAEDINIQLADPKHPTPNLMLNHRRFPAVWAVAEIIRTNRTRQSNDEPFVSETTIDDDREDFHSDG